MTKTCLPFLLLFTIAASAQELSLRALSGHWIDVQYAEALEKSRSPLEADKVVTPTALWLYQTKGLWRLQATDFHEGFERPVASIRALKGGYEFDAGEAEARSGSGHRIPFTIEKRGGAMLLHGAFFDETKPATYKRIDESADNWAMRLLLAGKYADEHGRAASISPDGDFMLPGAKPFKAAIVLDTSEACCDYVNTDRKSNTQYEDRIAYRWRGSTLELYEVITNPESECPIASAKTPFVALRPRR